MIIAIDLLDKRSSGLSNESNFQSLFKIYAITKWAGKQTMGMTMSKSAQSDSMGHAYIILHLVQFSFIESNPYMPLYLL